MLFVVISLFEMALKSSAKVLFCVPKCGKAVVCLLEKNALRISVFRVVELLTCEFSTY